MSKDDIKGMPDPHVYPKWYRDAMQGKTRVRFSDELNISQELYNRTVDGIIEHELDDAMKELREHPTKAWDFIDGEMKEVPSTEDE